MSDLQRPEKIICMHINKQNHMPPISFDIRQDVATRLTAGQTPKAIAETLQISLKSVYRLKRAFRQADGSYVAVAASIATKQAFTRDPWSRYLSGYWMNPS